MLRAARSINALHCCRVSQLARAVAPRAVAAAAPSCSATATTAAAPTATPVRAAPIATATRTAPWSRLGHSMGWAVGRSSAVSKQQQQQAHEEAPVRCSVRCSARGDWLHFRPFSTSATITPADKIRNVAIIAHVDHGKTTLVDKLLHACGASDQSKERAMDHNQLEKERGITILSKATAVDYRDGYVVNIVDTPGHGDFGGEVERVLCMVDGVVLLVDANEGVMTQTKFVLMKALKKGLPVIVVLNKMDSPMMEAAGDNYLDQVETSLFDLFVSLDANDNQLEYPTLYASAKQGWTVKSADFVKGKPGTEGMTPLFETILEHIPPPKASSPSDPFKMLVSALDHDDHLGRILIGRIVSGTIRTGDPLKAIDREGKPIETGTAVKLIARRGLSSVHLTEAAAGHIIGVAGLETTSVTSTVCSPTVTEPVPADPIDPAVISMTFGVNDSPLSGRDSDGSKMTMGHIVSRLEKELQSNVSLQVHRSMARKDKIEVHGRGELQLGILIETMRREGFEISVSPPEVLYKTDEKGKRLEPIEELIIDVDSEFTGAVIDILSNRKGDLVQMKPGPTRSRLEFYVPSRALIGLRAELNTETRGTATVNTLFHEYAPYKGSLSASRRGALISSENGSTTAYALQPLEARGILFVGPGTPVYTGMVIGENSRSLDLDVNPVRAKALTNFRTVLKDDNVRLARPRTIGLEEAIATVREDELIEVTPKAIRIRKATLDPNLRAKQAKAQKRE